MKRRLTFRHILGPAGLESDRTLVVSDDGVIEAIVPSRAEGPGGRAPSCAGFLALPGLPNAHSHAFQRALAGFGEAARGEDSFWGWREAMYRLANALSPEDAYAVARHAYAEMLRGGFTSVAEFHYLHHRADGGRGPEMARAVIEAAESVGLPLVLLPTLYQRGGFGEGPKPEQRRFVHERVDDFLELMATFRPAGSRAGREGGFRLGVAIHSLRAVPPEALPPFLKAARSLLGEQVPVHIHVSEQRAEVDACRAAYGLTPIRLLSESVNLDARWSLVHATHASRAELDRVREAGSTVVLCPLTEAYLGDGLFPADEYARAGGRIAVGSDANVRIDAVGELRWLEFSQRLRTERRARLATPEGVGGPLWRRAAEGGAAALAEPIGAIAPGRRADLVVLDEQADTWLGQGPETVMDAWLVGGGREDIAAVYAGGRRVVERGRLETGDDTREAFARVVARWRGGAEAGG
ncbi:MAG: formimidoylglutamate deiminase [Gemmatimonadota bacterium]